MIGEVGGCILKTIPKHFYGPSPPQECGIKMAQVSQLEVMLFNENVVLEEKLKRLSLIMEIFQCDIQKILSEMQLFHFAESCR